ncbi:MAG: hypothetical protein PHH08_00330 [Candidatus ainarchaeum sp.]|nr:hypothetical protein [Candidatus ainarchaeum sp.]
MKRTAMLLVLLLAFAGIANAVSLSAPQEIPAGVNWSFVAEFDSFNFNEAKFFLDEKQVSTVFTYNSALFVAPNSTDSSLALNVSPSGNKVFISMSGLAQGEHNLRADLFTGNEKTGSVNAKIVVSSSLDQGYKDEVQKSLDSLKANTNSFAEELNRLKAQLDSAKTAVDSLQAGKTDSDQKAAEISQSIEKIDGELKLLISEISDLKQEMQKHETAQAEQKGALDGLLGMFSKKETTAQSPENTNEQAADTNTPAAENTAATTGLVGLGFSGTALWAFIGIIVVIAGVLAFLFVKQRGLEINLGSFGSGTRSYDDDQGVLGSTKVPANTEDQKHGKWSFEKTPEKPASSGLHFGNLIRRNR